MTNRKALIERIQAMQLGTQEMLDAAADDATLIPFETLFADASGAFVWRCSTKQDDSHSVYMGGDGEMHFYEASELFPVSEE